MSTASQYPSPDSGLPSLNVRETEYAWELASLGYSTENWPAQGAWTEEDYQALTDHENHRIEFVDGRLEFLEMPTEVHESMIQFLFLALHGYVTSRKLGKVYNNGIRLRIRPGKLRLPDVIFLHKDNFHARHNRVWEGADIAMEVVSDDPRDRQRDYEEKLADYAERGVAEYWIVDFERKLVLVHKLENEAYVVDGEYAPAQQAKSALLEGFAVDVAELFAATEDVPE